MDFKYVVEATNEIFRVMSGPQEPTRETLSAALTLGCEVLERLSRDRQFFESLRSLLQENAHDTPEYQSIIQDLACFTSEFLSLETEQLKKTGLSCDAISSLIADADRLYKQVANKGSLDLVALRANIIKLRNEACRFSRTLDYGPTRRHAIDFLGPLGLGVGGAAIIGLNAGAFGLSAGMSVAASQVSATLGTALITTAVESVGHMVTRQEGHRTSAK